MNTTYAVGVLNAYVYLRLDDGGIDQGKMFDDNE